MGRLLSNLGLRIYGFWCKFQCLWNWLISKLMFNVALCPHKLCTCKNK